MYKYMRANCECEIRCGFIFAPVSVSTATTGTYASHVAVTVTRSDLRGRILYDWELRHAHSHL